MEFEIKVMKKEGYGYEVTNPIRACGVEGSRTYLGLLRHKEGKVIRWERNGAINAEYTKHPVDEYTVTVIILNKKVPTLLSYTMYIDMYYPFTFGRFPEDFI